MIPVSSETDTQSYKDAQDDFNRSISNANFPCWDYIILRASNEQQAEGFEVQLNERKSKDLLPLRTHLAVIPDPDGKRVGSGGATLSVMSSLESVKNAKGPDYYASGASDIDGGTLFVAGEMGKTEAVYTGSNGKTNVANVRQMEQAFYNALSRYGAEGGETIVVETYLDGERVYQNTTEKAKARGNVWAKA